MSQAPARWQWISAAVVMAIHDRQISEHGGADGIRDLSAIESALQRPARAAEYSNPDLSELAALYAVGLASAHGFVDGNKRTAWVTARLFIRMQGGELQFNPLDAIKTMESVAAGTMDVEGLSDWFRDRMI